ncbi:lysophospholipase [Desulfosarcina widdelii]|uniref:Lysophospholipase n=1 Tax=Desulfosarcina widdelii TaxID=947919 RepID=A0A5K7Z1I5_9BACT|nr:alpha/beta hydrolase [Desulfosarcina widdelii]BBO74520.1 lysophospholipase [Desulfosarcina widdelii]
MTIQEEKRDRFAGSDGKSIFYRRLIPEKPRFRVVVSHGLGEHSGRYGNVAEALFPIGASLWILDHRGHGRSQGKRGHVSNFGDYVSDLKTMVAMAAAEGKGKGEKMIPTLVLGHSMGGLIALSYARQYPETIDGLVVSSPLLGVEPQPPAALQVIVRLLSVLWPTLSLSNKLDPTFISHDSDQVDAYVQSSWVHDRITARWFVQCMAEIQRTVAAPQEIRVPVLMQIAGDDHLVDCQASLSFFNALTVSDKTLCHYETLYHEIYNEKLPDREKVLADLKKWIGERFV